VVKLKIAYITKKRLEGNGRAVRMDHGKKVKKIFEGKLEGSRRERPKSRCLEDIQKYVREREVKR
jgi:hypothetical protein